MGLGARENMQGWLGTRDEHGYTGLFPHAVITTIRVHVHLLYTRSAGNSLRLIPVTAGRYRLSGKMWQRTGPYGRGNACPNHAVSPAL
jgi:hypothetical protein